MLFEHETVKKTDSEIILSYKNGDQEAFKELIARYSTMLYNFTAHIADRNNAPDIVQETFIKVWKNLSRFDPLKASFKTWVFTIARNTATDFLRKKKSILFSDIEKYDNEDMEFSEKIPDENLLPDELFVKLQDKEVINNILDNLRPNYREILILHYQENMTFDEIGKILKKPLNTVKSQHRRAIIELRENLENAPNLM
jgi:RNA polymerase sigma-70 factor (ECF subfamily)